MEKDANASSENDQQVIKAARLTVNLCPKANAALKKTSEITGYSRTEVINQAVQIYEMIANAQNNGGKVFIQDSKKSERYAIRFL